jgi:hypothetical protein
LQKCCRCLLAYAESVGHHRLNNQSAKYAAINNEPA